MNPRFDNNLSAKRVLIKCVPLFGVCSPEPATWIAKAGHITPVARHKAYLNLLNHHPAAKCESAVLSYLCIEYLLQGRPFLYTYKDADGNEKYEGFTVDLLNHVGEMVNFNYTIAIVPDGKFGKYVGGKWNGMIGELVYEVTFHYNVSMC